MGLGGHFCFLSGFFPISVKAATAERTVFSTAASLNERACSKALCSEMGFYVTLGLGMVGDMAAELCSPCAAEEIRPISAAGKHPASARREKSVAVSPAIAKEGISLIFSFSGCRGMTSVLQLKIQLQRTFSNI